MTEAVRVVQAQSAVIWACPDCKWPNIVLDSGMRPATEGEARAALGLDPWTEIPPGVASTVSYLPLEVGCDFCQARFAMIPPLGCPGVDEGGQ